MVSNLQATGIFSPPVCVRTRTGRQRCGAGGEILLFLFIILMLWSTAAFGAVKAQVDRFNLSELETLTLSIETGGDDDSEPETAALEKDFEVLSRNHSSSYSLINGSISSKSTWMIHLRPRHAGTLTIPALKVGSTTTQAITVQVSKAADRNDSGQGPTGNIWIDMQVEPKQVLVQQQAIVSVRIYQAAALNQAQLTEPSPANVIIERLGEDTNYQVTRNGRIWHVLERRYALFPQQSGQIKIEPIQLDGSIIVRNSNFFSQSTRPVRVRSNAVTLDVLAMPPDWDGGEWLPATGVELIEEWPSTTTFKVGEPVTRTLSLRSEGLLSSQLPGFNSMLPDYLKAYPDQAKLSDDKTFEGVSGLRQEKVAIMPMQPGTYILPQIDIPWWNTETGQKEVATIPPRTFKVVTAATAVKPALKQVEPEVKLPPAARIPNRPVSGQSGWKWLALITSAGWLLTLGWLWMFRKQGKRGEAGKDIRAASLKQARRSVELACRRNDAKACEQALLSFAQPGLDFSVNSLAAMADQCDSDLAREITSLEKCLYASGKKEWGGAGLLQAFQKADFRVLQPGATRQSVALPDIYPD
jgi:hypothetical protein